MKKTKKNAKSAFTLVELLAVIVILAVILVIAIPQILKTIEASRLGAIEDSAKLVAKQAEQDYLAQQTLNQYYNATSIPCTDVAKLSDDYDINNCSITYDENGIATVTLKGADNKKFNGITCTGTKDNMCCFKEGEESTCGSVSNSSNWLYAFGRITSASDTNAKTKWEDVGKTVFIRYNKDDLNEYYVCTMYKKEERNGEPICFKQEDWDNNKTSVPTLFDDIDGSKGICDVGSSYVYCGVGGSVGWRCGADVYDRGYCFWRDGSSSARCDVSDVGAACSES